MPEDRPAPPLHPIVLMLLAAVAALAMLSAVGCSEPLLAAKDERSPFDRYDTIRGSYATQYVEDKFGRRQPNLRARLGPKN